MTVLLYLQEAVLESVSLDPPRLSYQRVWVQLTHSWTCCHLPQVVFFSCFLLYFCLLLGLFFFFFHLLSLQLLNSCLVSFSFFFIFFRRRCLRRLQDNLEHRVLPYSIRRESLYTLSKETSTRISLWVLWDAASWPGWTCFMFSLLYKDVVLNSNKSTSFNCHIWFAATKSVRNGT